MCGLILVEARNIMKQESNILKKIAVEAAREKGCLGEFQGSVDTRKKTVSSCFAGGFIEEFLIVPVCEQNCENVRLRPLAKVMFHCNEDPSTVECLAI